LTYKNKICIECGIVFEPKSSKSKFCCKDCSYKNKRKKILKWRKDNPEEYKLRCQKYNRNRDLKHLKEGKKVLKYTIIECEVCGKKFKPKSGISKYCSKKCYKYVDNEFTKIKRKNNIDMFREYDKKQYYKFHDKYKKRKVELKLIKYHSDESFKLTELLRSRLRKILKGKIKKTYSAIDLVGCSILQLKKHLEEQFKEGMCWENHGLYGWHIDHILPCSSFDMTIIDNQKKCFNYKNLQPLWATENLSKGGRI